MTLGATKRGRKIIGYRLAIDGSPYQAVSSARLATAHPTSPRSIPAMGSWLSGLMMEDVAIASSCDIMTAKLNAPGIDFQLIDGPTAQWSRLFQTIPGGVNYLTATFNEIYLGAIGARGTAGFDASGYIWIDQECLAYSASDPTTFTIAARGAFGIDGGSLSSQAHYVISGSARAPVITNWPQIWEGRRVALFRVTDADVGTPGTQVWRGIVSAAPKFNGVKWTLSCDSIASVLEGRFGGDLGQTVTPRGIHYLTGFQMWWAETTGAAPPDPSVTFTFQGVDLAPAYYETQEQFCSTLQTALQASMTGASANGTAYVVSEGPSGWHIEYMTGASAQKYFWVKLNPLSTAASQAWAIDMPLGVQYVGTATGAITAPVDVANGWGGMVTPSGGWPGSPVASTRYYLRRQTSGYGLAMGSVPRGQWSPYTAYDPGQLVLDLAASAGLPPNITAAAFDAGTDRGGTAMLRVSAVDTSAAQTITLEVPLGRGALVLPGDGSPAPFATWIGDSMKIRLGMSTRDADASLAGLLAYVIANSPGTSALGMMPSLRTADVDLTAFAAMTSAWSSRLFTRQWSTFPAHTLAEIIAGELLAVGFTLGLDATGRLIPVRIRFAAPDEPGLKQIARSELVTTGDDMMMRELHGIGMISEVQYSTNYDPVADSFTGPTYTIRDADSYAQSPSVRAIEIKQYSNSSVIVATGTDLLNPAAVQAGVVTMLDTLSGNYAIDTLRTVRDDINVGDVVSYVWPTSYTGNPGLALTRGDTQSSAIVIARKAGALEPVVELTLLASMDVIAGYAPGDRLASWSSLGGNQWDLTLTQESTAAASFRVGDYIRVRQWDSRALTTVSGQVIAGGAGGAVVRVQLAGTWTPSGLSWALEYDAQNTAGMGSSQQQAAFWAAATAIITWSSTPAEQYAP